MYMHVCVICEAGTHVPALFRHAKVLLYLFPLVHTGDVYT